MTERISGKGDVVVAVNLPADGYGEFEKTEGGVVYRGYGPEGGESESFLFSDTIFAALVAMAQRGLFDNMVDPSAAQAVRAALLEGVAIRPRTGEPSSTNLKSPNSITGFAV